MLVAEGMDHAGGGRPGAARVVLADRSPVFRARLRRVLVDEGIDVVGETASGEEAVVLSLELAPDVLVLEIDLDGMGGAETSVSVSSVAPEVRIVVLTIAAEERDVVDAVLAGACGCLHKGSTSKRLAAGIRSAAAGESLVSAPVAAELLRRVVTAGELSPRELEILRLLAAGKADLEIAATLYLTPRALRNSVTRILRKLQLRRRTAALSIS